MNVEFACSFLGWCAVINLLLLAWWFLFFFFAHELTYRFHTRWINVPPQVFDTLHYAGMGLYLMGIVLLNIVPWIALRLAS
jgi:hypothetical protein